MLNQTEASKSLASITSSKPNRRRRRCSELDRRRKLRNYLKFEEQHEQLVAAALPSASAFASLANYQSPIGFDAIAIMFFQSDV